MACLLTCHLNQQSFSCSLLHVKHACVLGKVSPAAGLMHSGCGDNEKLSDFLQSSQLLWTEFKVGEEEQDARVRRTLCFLPSLSVPPPAQPSCSISRHVTEMLRDAAAGPRLRLLLLLRRLFKPEEGRLAAGRRVENGVPIGGDQRHPRVV